MVLCIYMIYIYLKCHISAFVCFDYLLILNIYTQLILNASRFLCKDH